MYDSAVLYKDDVYDRGGVWVGTGHSFNGPFSRPLDSEKTVSD
jgi:hypothetical protein